VNNPSPWVAETSTPAAPARAEGQTTDLVVGALVMAFWATLKKAIRHI
jgi:hypothetical protein